MNYKKIGELCHSLKKSVKPESDTIYNVFSLPAFDDKMRPEKLSGCEIKSNKYRVFGNTILFNKLNVKYRRIWNIHKLTTNNNVSSTEFIPLVAENGVDQDYLYHCLRSDDVTFAMHAARKGTSNSQQRIDEDILFSYEIPVPSIEEQRKIASILNSIDERIKVNEEINDNLSVYKSSDSKLISPAINFGKRASLNSANDLFSKYVFWIRRSIGSTISLNDLAFSFGGRRTFISPNPPSQTAYGIVEPFEVPCA